MEYQVWIGQRIRALRVRHGFSQRQLALLANKDPQSLERVENGKSCPTVFYLKEIMGALGVSMVEFLKLQMSLVANTVKHQFCHSVALFTYQLQASLTR